jgi:hypothetical protein
MKDKVILREMNRLQYGDSAYSFSKAESWEVHDFVCASLMIETG